VAVGALLVVAFQCGPTPDCLRFSDCAEGLTCAAGKCVPPAGQGGGDDAAAGDGAAIGDGAVVGDVSTTGDGAVVGPTPDAAVGDACVGCADGGSSGAMDGAPEDAGTTAD
jgi:hypothetical protein